MDKEIVVIINWLVNGANEKQINALYELIRNEDIDFVEDLLGKEKFQELLDLYKQEECWK